MNLPSRGRLFLGVLLGIAWGGTAPAADWPQWRHDARRGNASPQELAATLHPQWTRELPATTPAWPDQPKMQYDLAYEPILVGQILVFGSPVNDRLTAVDVGTGKEIWRYYADGPIRFAPAAWENRVYFASDDGYLTCLDLPDGKLLWKFRGGPTDRKILGNQRLISAWPARGAPVVADGTVYFAASIWPFMGIFIHALDARTGAVLWTNDGDGSLFMKQPHNTDAFASVAPQGPLVVTGDLLLIPGGRSVPACYNRKTGKLVRYQLAENGKRGGGYEVAALEKIFINGGAAFELDTEKYLGEIGQQVVATTERLFAYSAGSCRVYDIRTAKNEEFDTIDRKGKTTKNFRWSMNEIGSCKLPPVECLILAGGRLYAGGKGFIASVMVNEAGKQLTLASQIPVEGTVLRLLAGADRLIAVTREGRIICLGADKTQEVIHQEKKNDEPILDAWTIKVRDLLRSAPCKEGYGIVVGLGNGRLVKELARNSSLHIIGLDQEADKVQSLRRTLDRDNLLGNRIALLSASPRSALPPYLANIIVIEPGWLANHRDQLPELYNALRPFGGSAYFFKDGEEKNLKSTLTSARLVNAEISETTHFVSVRRQGPLPDTANWTHEHGDAANTRVSKDQLVKAPLGLLWFGGVSNEGILPRHGHGPQPHVVDGRLIIEGVDLLRAIDIYTGRLLWETKLPGVGAFFNNVLHQPGANASGSNYVSTAGGIYVVYGKSCLKLDPATGQKLAEFKLPTSTGQNESPLWGYLNVAEEYLIGGGDPILDPKLLPMLDPKEKGDDPDPGSKVPGITGKINKLLKNAKGFNDNLSASMRLVVMHNQTGKVLWSVEAKSGFRHNATCVGGGRLYTIDRLSGQQLSKYKRLGEEPPFPSRLRVFDLKTGRELWSAHADLFGTWLSYSAKHDIVIESGRVARDTLLDEPKGMRAYNARDGAVLWFDKSFVGPAMIHGDTILQDQGGCDLVTGALKMRQDPITGQIVPWKWLRTYGCDTPSASEHLISFRSGAAGYFDLCNDGGTGNIGGLRSSCTNNQIVAGGILTFPDFTRTCTCAYQNQTSLALIHMPEAEMWTYFGTKEVRGAIQRLGINLGAAGDRRADDGTLWLEYPSIAGISPGINVATKPDQPDYFRRHASRVEGKWNWVASSGARGLRELTLQLGKQSAKKKYTVRLFFAEPDQCQAGQRRFHIEIQGREVCHDLDIAKETGGGFRSLVKEFTGIEAANELQLRLVPVAGVPVLCGLEIVAEDRK